MLITRKFLNETNIHSFRLASLSYIKGKPFMLLQRAAVGSMIITQSFLLTDFKRCELTKKSSTVLLNKVR